MSLMYVHTLLYVLSLNSNTMWCHHSPATHTQGDVIGVTSIQYCVIQPFSSRGQFQSRHSRTLFLIGTLPVTGRYVSEELVASQRSTSGWGYQNLFLRGTLPVSFNQTLFLGEILLVNGTGSCFLKGHFRLLFFSDGEKIVGTLVTGFVFTFLAPTNVAGISHEHVCKVI